MRPDLLILMLCADILPFTPPKVVTEQTSLFAEERQENRKTKDEIKKMV